MPAYAFGDSITAGANDSNGGWVRRLDRAVVNLGVGGEKTADLLKRIKNCKKADSIIIAIGVNDAFGGAAPATPMEKFRENIAKLIEASKKAAGKIAFIGLFPVGREMEDYSCSNGSIRLYNDAIKGECRKGKVLFIDVFAEFIGKDYERLLDDGLHPNSDGHRAIAEFIRPILVQNKVI